MSPERRESSGFSVKIEGIKQLFDRLQVMINYSADVASSEDRVIMALIRLPINSDAPDKDAPWKNIIVPYYGKIIDADPLFEEVDVEIKGGFAVDSGEYAFTHIVFWF